MAAITKLSFDEGSAQIKNVADVFFDTGSNRIVPPLTELATGELRVASIRRGALPEGDTLGHVRVVPDAPADEFLRFTTYLHHGLDGRQPPKAGLVRLLSPTPAGGAVECFLVAVLPPSARESEGSGTWALALIDPSCTLLGPLQVIWENQRQEAARAAAAAAAEPTGDAATSGAPATTTTTTAAAAAVAVEWKPAPSTNGHGQEYIPPAVVAAAKRGGSESVDRLVRAVCEHILDGSLPFPYKRSYTPLTQVKAWFMDLCRLPSAGDVKPYPYGLHGVLDKGRTVAVHSRGLQYAAPAATPRLGAGMGMAAVTCTQPHAITIRGDGVGASPGSGEAAPSPSALPLSTLLLLGPAYKPFDRAFNEAGGRIVDYFTEEARMGARRRYAPLPPVQEWRQEATARAVVAKAIGKYSEVSAYSLRHGQYGVLTSVCNLFHANLARALLHLCGATRVLDPCAGWGDRLIGAMSCPGVTRYLAFDPNPHLVEGHGAMVHSLAELAPGKGRYEVLCAPFEHGLIPAQDLPAGACCPPDLPPGWAFTSGTGTGVGFDCVLTSPPYFDLELYEGSEQSTSTTAGGGLSGWLTSWYFPMLSKAWAALSAGGHMAIYINDHAGVGEEGEGEGEQQGQGEQVKDAPSSSASLYEDVDVCLPMLAHMAGLPSCEWVGCLGIEGETGKIRPLWLWRKGDLAKGGYNTGGASGSSRAAVPPLYATLAKAYSANVIPPPAPPPSLPTAPAAPTPAAPSAAAPAASASLAGLPKKRALGADAPGGLPKKPAASPLAAEAGTGTGSGGPDQGQGSAGSGAAAGMKYLVWNDERGDAVAMALDRRGWSNVLGESQFDPPANALVGRVKRRRKEAAAAGAGEGEGHAGATTAEGEEGEGEALPPGVRLGPNGKLYSRGGKVHWRALDEGLFSAAWTFLWKPSVRVKLAGGVESSVHALPLPGPYHALGLPSKAALQIVNKCPHPKPLASKTGLIRSLHAYYTSLQAQEDYTSLHAQEGSPALLSLAATMAPSFILGRAGKGDRGGQEAEWAAFHSAFASCASSSGASLPSLGLPPAHTAANLWIIKPDFLYAGKGIEMSSDIEAIRALVQERSAHGLVQAGEAGGGGGVTVAAGEEWVVQKYLEAPLLVEGRKFDMRLNVLLLADGRVYIHDQPFIRTASVPYSLLGAGSEASKLAHITNNWYQVRAGDLFGAHEQGNILSLDQLGKRLEVERAGQELEDELAVGPGGEPSRRTRGAALDPSTLRTAVLPACTELVLDALCAAWEAVGQGASRPWFEMFGADILLDATGRPWLLEVNTNPSLDFHSGWVDGVAERLVDDMLTIGLDGRGQAEVPVRVGGWEMVYWLPPCPRHPSPAPWEGLYPTLPQQDAQARQAWVEALPHQQAMAKRKIARIEGQAGFGAARIFGARCT